MHALVYALIPIAVRAVCFVGMQCDVVQAVLLQQQQVLSAADSLWPGAMSHVKSELLGHAQGRVVAWHGGGQAYWGAAHRDHACDACQAHFPYM